jgi:hypothetical protein
MNDFFELLNSSESKLNLEHQQLKIAFARQKKTIGLLIPIILLESGILLILYVYAQNKRKSKYFL